MEYHILALAPTRNGFYDPESRINLTLLNPQAVLPVGSPITRAIRTALRSGGIIDKKGTILAELEKEKQAAQTPPFRPGPVENAKESEKPAVQTVEVPEQESQKEEPKQTPPKPKTVKRSPAKKAPVKE